MFNEKDDKENIKNKQIEIVQVDGAQSIFLVYKFSLYQMCGQVLSNFNLLKRKRCT